MTAHPKGLLVTTLGVLLVVPDSLFVSLIDAEPMATAFWRALTAGLLLVWWIIGEHPGSLALVGGVVVIGALLAANLHGLIKHRSRLAQG